MKKDKHIALFIALLFLISIITGFIYGLNNYYDLSNYMKELGEHNNLFFPHLTILIIFLFSTLSLLGVFIQSIFIGIEGVSVGYILSTFYLNFKFKGLLYGLMTLLINNVFFIIILFYLFIISYKYIKKNVNNIVGVNKDYVGLLIRPLLKKYLLILTFLIIYDVIIYFFGNIFLNYLRIML